MSSLDSPARRVDRVDTSIRLGPDAQVDDKAMVITPQDPAATDPFLVLAEDWFSSPGFEWHPHRGIETVTMVVDGALEHGDNIGNAGVLEPGDVQWMTAGRGIIHRELAHQDEHVHTLQLWVNLPAASKLVDTGYQDVRAADRPHITASGTDIDVISGRTSGVDGPATNHWPISGALITLEPDTTVRYQVPAGHRLFAYVLDGAATIAGALTRAGQVAWSDPISTQAMTEAGDGDSALELVGADPDAVTRVLVYGGRPIGEPVAMGGPFVMNTQDEIHTAFDDYRRGTFGEVPRQARLTRR
jgi:hypothetical protein